MTPTELALRDPNRPAPIPHELSLDEIVDRAVENGKRKFERWGKRKVKEFFQRIGLGEGL